MSTVFRHACTRCGASCMGHRVLLQDGEAQRMVAMGALLGVRDPVDGETLRHADGRCVFLGADALCRIHAQAGLAAKPLTCQQYPVIVVRAESEVRVGLDPGCSSTWQTWQSGPELEVGRAIASRVALDAGLREEEAQVLAHCEASRTTAELLEALTGQGFGGAWVAAWAAGCRSIGFPLPDRLPGWTLDADSEALTVEVVRRMVYLRFAAALGSPTEVALLTLGGALFCGWKDATPAAYGVALSQWTRAVRLPTTFARVRAVLPS